MDALMNHKELKEMCIYIRYSLSIIEKVFHYEENEISVIKCRDDIWFKAKQVATLLGYLDPGRSIRWNVETNWKRGGGGGRITHPFSF